MASRMDRQLRRSLYEKLLLHSKMDYEGRVQIEPFVVVEVKATETFHAVKPVYNLRDGFRKQVERSRECLAVEKSHRQRDEARRRGCGAS